MPEKRKIAVIVNPRSAGGKTAQRWPEISRILEARLGAFVTRVTEASGGTVPARELLRQGYNYIVAAGGDGTISQVANGFFDHDEHVRPEARLGILPLGTGRDFCRSLGISGETEDLVETLASGIPLPIDVGKATFCDHDGTSRAHYFVNVASFGMGGEVAARSRNAARMLGGGAAFLWATCRTFMGYRAKRVRLELDGKKLLSEFLITNVAVGNGEFHGGGMHPCPRAILNDGMLEVTVIDYLGFFELARDIRVLYSEDVYRHPKVHHFRARTVAAEGEEPATLELDGEPLGRLPLKAEVLPERLRVIIPPQSPLLSGKSA